MTTYPDFRFYTVHKMRKVDDYYPHPEGEIEEGWYYYAEPEMAPIGPFPSLAAAAADALKFIGETNDRSRRLPIQ